MHEAPEEANGAQFETEGLVVGISGWFTPHGVRYHEDRRARDEIAPNDWVALLAHADSIDFFTRPDPAPASPEARIYHVGIVSGGRSRGDRDRDHDGRTARRAHAIPGGRRRLGIAPRQSSTGRLSRRHAAHRNADFAAGIADQVVTEPDLLQGRNAHTTLWIAVLI